LERDGLEIKGLLEGEGLEREGVKRLFVVKTSKETFRFTVPPAVAFLNYILEVVHFRRFFPNCDFSRGFLYISLISQEGSAKLRWAGRGCAAPRSVCL
jgi:hypothetical protein